MQLPWHPYRFRQHHETLSQFAAFAQGRGDSGGLGRHDSSFLTHILDFAYVSSRSLVDCGGLNYGQFTGLQRPYFTFNFFFGRESWLRRARAIASEFGRRSCLGRAPMNEHLPYSGSISRACPNLRQLHGFMLRQVYICRAKSTYVAGKKFFLGLQALYCRRFPAVFDGLWTVELWAIHRLTTALLHLWIFFERESWFLRARAFASKFGCHNGPRRAPTRGAPTRFRQHHGGLAQFDAVTRGWGVF